MSTYKKCLLATNVLPLNPPTVTTTYGYGSNAGDKSQVVLQTVVYGGEQPKVTTTAYDYFGNVIEEGDLLGAKTTTQYNQTKSYGAEFFESESESGIVKAQTTQAPEVIGERTIYANVDAKTSQSTTYSDNLNITSTVDRFGRQEISINAPNGNQVLSYSSDSGLLTLSKYDNNSRLIEERVYLVTGDKFFEITNDNSNELLPIMENFYNNSTIPIDGNGRKYHQYSIVENEYTEQGDLISTKEKGSGNEYIRYEEYSQLVEKTNNGNKLNTSITKVYDPTTENAITPTLMKETISKTYTDRKDRVIKSIQTVKKYSEGAVTYVTEKTINTYEPISDRLESVTTKYNDGAREKTTTTSYEYDYLGNQQQIIRNDGKSNFVEYNALGDAVRSYDYVSYDGEKYFTTNTYYSNGLLKSSEIPLDGNNSQNVYYKYDAAGNVVSKEVSIGVSGKSEKTEYAYDANGRLIQVTNYLKHKTGVINEEKQITQYLYDQDGNEIRRYTGLTEPLYMELDVYNQNDNNEDGNEHETYIDASGNTKILYGADKERFTRGGVTYQIRVGFFNSSHVQDYRVAKYEYDLENKLKSYTDPDGRVETYSYDFKGNLVKTVDKEGNITKNTYDAKQRITETIVEDAEEKDADIVTSYTYNVLDELEQVNDKTFTYDVMSRVITETDTGLLPTKQIKKEYGYSVDGLLETKKILVGNAVKLHQTYSYDVLDRLSQVYEVEGGEKNLVVSYGYDLNGNRTSEEVGSKTVNYEYNRNNQVTNVSNKYSNAVVSNYSYTYDRYGRQSGKTDTVYENNVGNSSTTAYGYDLLGRIISESGNGNSSLVYEYDKNNNRSKLTSTQNGIASVTTYQYNKNDELMNESVVVGENTAKNITDYWYDLNGNQIAKTYAIIDSNVTAPVEPSAPVATDAPEAMPENNGEDIGISIRNVSDITDGEKPELSEYDALNRLVKVKIGNKVYKYGYDENGLRTWKEVNGVKTYFVWDDDQIVLEINENENVKKKYVRGLSLIYSEDDDSTTNDRVYYNYNGHGDVVQLLDSEGNVTKYYKYDSFGNEVNEDENDENPWRYCGEYYDKETKTVYLRARYYNPSYGRFTTQDPAQYGLNWYVYCDNEPVMNVDYLGLWTTKIGKGHSAIMSSLGVKTLISEANYYTDKGEKPQKYFHKINENKLISRIIETYNAAVDFRYNNKKPNNYSDDLENAVNKGVNNLNYNKDSSKNSRRSWVCLGYAFHAYQDMYAHKTMVKPLEGPSKGSWISSSSLSKKYKKGWIDKENYLVSRFNNAKSYSKTLLDLFLKKKKLKAIKKYESDSINTYSVPYQNSNKTFKIKSKKQYWKFITK